MQWFQGFSNTTRASLIPCAVVLLLPGKAMGITLPSVPSRKAPEELPTISIFRLTSTSVGTGSSIADIDRGEGKTLRLLSRLNVRSE